MAGRLRTCLRRAESPKNPHKSCDDVLAEMKLLRKKTRPSQAPWPLEIKEEPVAKASSVTSPRSCACRFETQPPNNAVIKALESVRRSDQTLQEAGSPVNPGESPKQQLNSRRTEMHL